MCILFAVPFYNTLNDLFYEIMEGKLISFPTPFLLVNGYIFVILLLIPISVVHELFHGLAYWAFGGKVKYGFKGIYAFTRETSGKAIGRSCFLIVLLLPLVMISIISRAFPGGIGAMIFILNLFGSTGDIYMSLLLAACSSESRIIDRNYGFDVVN